MNTQLYISNIMANAAERNLEAGVCNDIIVKGDDADGRKR